jgi:hypothetical protein
MQIAAVRLPTGLVDMVRFNGSVEVTRVQGRSLRVEEVSSAPFGCYTHNSAVVPQGVDYPVVNGTTNVAVNGWYNNRSRQRSMCSIVLRVRVGDGAGSWGAPIELVAPAQPIGAREYKTVAAPSALRSRLDFRLTDAFGTCSGTSQMLGPAYRVGVNHDDAGKISFTIRSGPLGTRCEFSTQHVGPWRFRDGVQLESMWWTMTKDGSGCWVGNGRFTRGQTSVSPAQTQYGFVVTHPGSIPDALGPVSMQIVPVSGMMPLNVFLECAKTPNNDRGIRLVLESVTFSGPPGFTIPE